ncbi:MAG: hypothetical protein ABIG89_04675 [Candidatus Woesearchaeota archaeon]
MKEEYRFIKELVRKEIFDGKNIIDLLRYEDTSLWFLIEMWTNNPSKHYYSIKELFNIANNNIDDKKINKELNKKKGYAFGSMLKISFIMKLIMRKIFSPKNKIEESDIIITTHPSFYQNNYNVRNGLLIEKLKSNYKTSTILYEDTGTFGKKIKKIIKIYEDTNTIERFLDFCTFIKIMKKSRKYLKIWKKIIRSDRFKSQFIINNINYYEIMFPLFNDVISKMIIESIYYIEITKNMINKIKPKAVITTGGSTTQVRSINYTSKSMNILNFEIQEGLILDTLYYCITDDDIRKGYKIPDLTFVYGNSTKKFLIKEKGFKENDIKVVGSPNSDKVEILRKKIDKKNEIEKLNLNPELKTISFYTQPASTKNMIYHFKRIIKAVKDIGNINLIIKQHPRDCLEKEYFKIIKEKEMKNIKIIKDKNMYEIMLISDVALVFPTSTVCLEAILCKIKMIILNFELEHPTYKNYLEIGNKTVYNENEIKEAIIDVLSLSTKKSKGDIINEKCDKERKRFIDNELYKVDGNVNSRIKEYIKGFIE